MSDIFNVVKALMQREKGNIHTVAVAKVTKVNKTTINCQPVINRVFNGESKPMPEFAEVPLITIQGGSSYIHLPVAVDDYCLLFISERCFDRWYKGVDNMPPLSERMFSYSDSFAIVGVNPEAKAIEIPPDGTTLIKTRDGDTITLKSDESMEIKTNNGDFIKLTNGKTIEINTKDDDFIKLTSGESIEINTKIVKIITSADVEIEATGNMTAQIGGNANITAIGKTIVAGTTVDIDGGGGASGMVVTTDCICPIIGIPH